MASKQPLLTPKPDNGNSRAPQYSSDSTQARFVEDPMDNLQNPIVLNERIGKTATARRVENNQVILARTLTTLKWYDEFPKDGNGKLKLETLWYLERFISRVRLAQLQEYVEEAKAKLQETLSSEQAKKLSDHMEQVQEEAKRQVRNGNAAIQRYKDKAKKEYNLSVEESTSKIQDLKNALGEYKKIQTDMNEARIKILNEYGSHVTASTSSGLGVPGAGAMSSEKRHASTSPDQNINPPKRQSTMGGAAHADESKNALDRHFRF